MLNNPIIASLPVGQRGNQPQSGKHVCIFGLERKGALLTAEVVCAVCGINLSSEQDRLPGTKRPVISTRS
jgi:hypothetical protein